MQVMPCPVEFSCKYRLGCLFEGVHRDLEFGEAWNQAIPGSQEVRIVTHVNRRFELGGCHETDAFVRAR
jgi:hypothetical protein